MIAGVFGSHLLAWRDTNNHTNTNTHTHKQCAQAHTHTFKLIFTQQELLFIFRMIGLSHFLRCRPSHLHMYWYFLIISCAHMCTLPLNHIRILTKGDTLTCRWVYSCDEIQTLVDVDWFCYFSHKEITICINVFRLSSIDRSVFQQFCNFYPKQRSVWQSYNYTHFIDTPPRGQYMTWKSTHS